MRKIKKRNLVVISILFLLGFVSVVYARPREPMDEREFAAKSDDNSRCNPNGIPNAYCVEERIYALDENLITKEAYNWAYTNKYYPVFDRNDEIYAVCECGCDYICKNSGPQTTLNSVEKGSLTGFSLDIDKSGPQTIMNSVDIDKKMITGDDLIKRECGCRPWNPSPEIRPMLDLSKLP